MDMKLATNQLVMKSLVLKSKEAVNVLQPSEVYDFLSTGGDNNYPSEKASVFDNPLILTIGPKGRQGGLHKMSV